MKEVTYKMNCRICYGTGYFYEDDLDSANYCQIVKCECYSPKKTFVISDESCNECKGTGKVDFSRTVYSKTFFGSNSRNNVSGKEDCPNCMGVGKKHFEVTIVRCNTCSGLGKVKSWQKGFFGSEVLKVITCPDCKGSKNKKQISKYSY